MLLENVITNSEDLQQLVSSLKANRKTIGVVPTMGALHEGHLSLVRESFRQCDETIVTIFVNPTQFAVDEDLEKYPQTLEADLAKLAEVGSLQVFAPTREEMYPDGFSTSLVPPAVSRKLEGEHRPTHFAGVATVVLKLLNLTQADVAFFGQKDFQQLLVIQRMVEDLNMPIRIQACPIVRESDGLALSSRNAYLSPEEREIGLTLNRTLDHIETSMRNGRLDGFELMGEMRQMLIDGGVTRVDYVMIADPETLEPMDEIQFPVVALIAAFVGKTRLIDNRLIKNSESSPVPD